jgi:hypothetical protein
MKIVHVETGRHFYGGAQQVIWLIEGLAARGIENLLVCPPDSEIDKIARSASIPVQNLGCSGDLDLKFAWRLAKLAGSAKPDVVHCHSRRGADFLGGHALALKGIPAVLSRRVDHTEPGFLAKWRYRPFRKVIAISENIAAVLEDGQHQRYTRLSCFSKRIRDRRRRFCHRDGRTIDSTQGAPISVRCHS